MEELLKFLKDFDPLISLIIGLLPVSIAIIALYYGSWKPTLKRPKLKYEFKDKEYPYVHKLGFERFPGAINLPSGKIFIYKPGFNVRTKIINKGKTTARGVRATVEKIEFFKAGKKINPPRYYHPTMVKWSGEHDWKPIDIVPESHFFLDVFWAKNETFEQVFLKNSKKYKSADIWIKDDLLEKFIKRDIQLSEEVFWNVWVDTSWERGIPELYDFEGLISIHFVINAENCNPLKFRVKINWTVDKWDHPDIKITTDVNLISKLIRKAMRYGRN